MDREGTIGAHPVSGYDESGRRGMNSSREGNASREFLRPGCGDGVEVVGQRSRRECARISVVGKGVEEFVTYYVTMSEGACVR